MKRRYSIATVPPYIAVASIATIQLLPLAWASVTSLKSLERAFEFPPQWSIGDPQWTNYTESMTALPLSGFLLNSLVISLSSSVGAVLTASMAGFVLARLEWRGRRYWLILLIGSMCLPAQILLIPHFLTYEWLGWVNTYKPLIVPAWLGGGAFNVFVFRQYFRMIPRDVDDVATTDGATTGQLYWHMLLPMAKPAVVVVGTLSFVYHWHALLNPLLYLSDFRTFPVSLGLRMFQTTAGTWINLLMAASLVSLLPPVVVFAVGQRFFRTGAPTGARW